MFLKICKKKKREKDVSRSSKIFLSSSRFILEKIIINNFTYITTFYACLELKHDEICNSTDKKSYSLAHDGNDIITLFIIFSFPYFL